MHLSLFCYVPDIEQKQQIEVGGLSSAPAFMWPKDWQKGMLGFWYNYLLFACWFSP